MKKVLLVLGGVFLVYGIIGCAKTPVVVEEKVYKPTIVVDPQTTTIYIGRTVTFSVSVTGTNPFTFQWQKNSLDIPHAMDSMYTTPAGTLADSGLIFRCIVSNAVGKDTSAEACLKVSLLTDIDGNAYSIVTIGAQTWMVENLKATRLNDSTPIPLVTDSVAWVELITPGYCWYDNNQTAYKNTYGALYNWYAVNTGKLAPAGWHVATDEEWTTLTTFLGGEGVAGGKLKETGLAHWAANNTGATNEGGFTALPGGLRDEFKLFVNMSYDAFYWTATEGDMVSSGIREIHYNYVFVNRYSSYKYFGLSVRCIRD